MTDRGPKIGDTVLDGRYELLREIKGSVGRGHVYLGSMGKCRYCGTDERTHFRSRAHTFPEALGNKWVYSRDECDDCNTDIFSHYDEELTKAVSPFLTLGGVKGKRNRTRQTGRTDGRYVIEQRRGDGRRSIVVTLKDAGPDNVVFDPRTGKMRMTIPIANVPFRPRDAYKALVKMGVALLPDDELGHYEKLISWLRNPADTEDFPCLEVAVSFASIGNAPPFAYGALLRRTNPADLVPHILFLFSAGSVCCQIDLMSDRLEDHLPPVPRGSVKINHSITISDEAGQNIRTIKIRYGEPAHLNWASRQLTPQPIEAMILDFCPTTCEGRFTPVFRSKQ